MGICLHHIEAIIRDLSSLIMILSLHVLKKGNGRKTLSSNGLPYSWQTQWCKLQLCTVLCL